MQCCFFIAWFCLCSTCGSQVSLSDASLLPCNGSTQHPAGRSDSAAGTLLPSWSWDGLCAQDSSFPPCLPQHCAAGAGNKTVWGPRRPSCELCSSRCVEQRERLSCSKYRRVAVSLVPLLPPRCCNLYYGEVWGTPCCHCKPNFTLMATSWEAERAAPFCSSRLSTLIFEMDVSAFVKGR